ncbi:MAG: O-antigen polymerase, partial [Bryobacterales bacterium]|nr:O-antigen polymerase [Bryobacterales bacterium]
MSSDTPVNLKNLPWGSFLFLTVTFWFCSRPNFFYSVEDPPVAAALQGARPDDWTKALALAVFTVWSGYTLLRGRRFSLSVKLAPLAFLLGYIGWCAASILWSDHVGMTVLKLVPLLISCLGAVAMCYRFALEELAALSFLSCSAMAAVGLVAEIALGSFQPWDADYRFKGVWHPNLQA